MDLRGRDKYEKETVGFVGAKREYVLGFMP